MLNSNEETWTKTKVQLGAERWWRRTAEIAHVAHTHLPDKQAPTQNEEQSKRLITHAPYLNLARDDNIEALRWISLVEYDRACGVPLIVEHLCVSWRQREEGEYCVIEYRETKRLQLGEQVDL